ncbi:Imm50 family immunity protein [Nocardia sp. NPDC058705]|uniref:Imm50 family immunity protein n=1 Tax=Nocardia sp. NPDC058705 TaxID=3346609 RepID=UPI00368AF3DE
MANSKNYGDGRVSWVEALTDSRSVRAIFGSLTPSLDGVVLHEARLHRDGPSVYLRFDFCEFPVDPPRKWAIMGYNTVQLELCLTAVESVAISGFSTASVIDLDISTYRCGEKTVVRARTSGTSTTHLDIVAGFAYVSKISAYLKDPSSSCFVDVDENSDA